MASLLRRHAAALISLGAVLAYCVFIQWMWGWGRILAAWGAIGGGPVALALGLMIVTHLIRCLRVYDYFRQDLSGAFLRLFRVTQVHNLANILLPFRAALSTAGVGGMVRLLPATDRGLCLSASCVFLHQPPVSRQGRPHGRKRALGPAASVGALFPGLGDDRGQLVGEGGDDRLDPASSGRAGACARPRRGTGRRAFLGAAGACARRCGHLSRGHRRRRGGIWRRCRRTSAFRSQPGGCQCPSPGSRLGCSRYLAQTSTRPTCRAGSACGALRRDRPRDRKASFFLRDTAMILLRRD